MASQDEVLTVVPPGQHDGASELMPMQLPPLTISALMVTKADLVAALRAYVPHLADIEVIDDDRFLLTVRAEHPETNGSR